MNGMILRTVAVFLSLGLALWGPAVPGAFAQVEITPEIREACTQFEPGLRDVALNELLPKLEEAQQPDASPEATAEAKAVETTAAAIHEAGQSTLANLEVPDAAKLQEKLTSVAGVAAPVAQELAQHAQATLEQAKRDFAAGKPGDAEAALRELQKSFEARGVDSYAMEKLGGGGFERVAFSRDCMGTALETHFRDSFTEMASRSGTEGLSTEAMRGMMEQMAACNISPEIFRGPAGEYHGPGPTGEYVGKGPSPEAIAMTDQQKVAYETWKSGDFAAMEKMHMEAMKAGYEAMEKYGTPMDPATMEKMMTEHMASGGTMEFYRETTTTTPTADAPRTETSGHSETKAQTYADKHSICPTGTTHTEGVEQGPGHCV